MTPEIKHIRLEETQRLRNFPYPIAAAGYSMPAPAVKFVEKTFTGFIEFALRFKSLDDRNSVADMTLNGTRYQVPYPHAIIKIPGMKYEYRDFPERDVFYFSYPMELLPELQKLGVDENDLCWHYQSTPEIEFLIGKIMKCLSISQESGVADKLDLYCFELMAELLLAHKLPEKPERYEEDLVKRMDSYIQFHIADVLSVDEIAQRFQISRSSFFRYWKTYFHTTPAKYIGELRLREACRRLQNTNLKVSEISDSMHFSDPAYFCLMFRKKFGMSPNAFRAYSSNSSS